MAAIEYFFFALGMFLQFILEVAGAGGAIWGMSEVWQLRGYGRDLCCGDGMSTNHFWRFPANTVFVLGALRYIFRYVPENGSAQALVSPHAWFHDMKESQSKFMNTKKDDPKYYTPTGILTFEAFFFLLGTFYTFVLEVAGAGGAWWGMSEVWQMRGYGREVCCGDGNATNHEFRWVANAVFVIAAIRMIQKYLPNHVVNTAIVAPHEYKPTMGSVGAIQREAFFCLVGMFLQFILEVAGAGGAIWGMSEVWQMRGYGQLENGLSTNHSIRYPANIVFSLGAIRYIQKYCPDHGIHDAMNSPHDWLREKLSGGRRPQAGQDAGDERDL